LIGSWNGYTLLVDASFTIVDTYNSFATVADSGDFSGSDKYGPFIGTFNSGNTVYGRWQGTFQNNTTSGSVSVFMTADKTFVASWACDGTGFPEGCSFSSWGK